MSRRKGIVKNKPEISEIENRKILVKIMKAKRCFFESANKIDNSPAELMKTEKRDPNDQYQELKKGSSLLIPWILRR